MPQLGWYLANGGTLTGDSISGSSADLTSRSQAQSQQRCLNKLSPEEEITVLRGGLEEQSGEIQALVRRVIHLETGRDWSERVSRCEAELAAHKTVTAKLLNSGVEFGSENVEALSQQLADERALREVEVSSLRVGIEAIKVEMQECSKRMARTSRQDVEQIVGELTASREVEISALRASVEALKAEMQESSTHMARTARHDMEKLVRDSTMERASSIFKESESLANFESDLAAQKRVIRNLEVSLSKVSSERIDQLQQQISDEHALREIDVSSIRATVQAIRLERDDGEKLKEAVRQGVETAKREFLSNKSEGDKFNGDSHKEGQRAPTIMVHSDTEKLQASFNSLRQEVNILSATVSNPSRYLAPVEDFVSNLKSTVFEQISHSQAAAKEAVTSAASTGKTCAELITRVDKLSRNPILNTGYIEKFTSERMDDMKAQFTSLFEEERSRACERAQSLGRMLVQELENGAFMTDTRKKILEHAERLIVLEGRYSASMPDDSIRALAKGALSFTPMSEASTTVAFSDRTGCSPPAETRKGYLQSTGYDSSMPTAKQLSDTQRSLDLLRNDLDTMRLSIAGHKELATQNPSAVHEASKKTPLSHIKEDLGTLASRVDGMQSQQQALLDTLQGQVSNIMSKIGAECKHEAPPSPARNRQDDDRNNSNGLVISHPSLQRSRTRSNNRPAESQVNVSASSLEPVPRQVPAARSSENIEIDRQFSVLASSSGSRARSHPVPQVPPQPSTFRTGSVESKASSYTQPWVGQASTLSMTRLGYHDGSTPVARASSSRNPSPQSTPIPYSDRDLRSPPLAHIVPASKVKPGTYSTSLPVGRSPTIIRNHAT